MNNKGFTLVELLATIVILGIVMGIATYGVISAIDSSKKKSEEIFVSKFASAIESYLALNGDKLGEKDGGEGSSNQNLIELNSFKLRDLADKDFIDKDKFINPRNKKNCYIEDAEIMAFRDEQYVYYYYFDFKQLGVGEDECLVGVEDENNELVLKYKSNSSDLFNGSVVDNSGDESILDDSEIGDESTDDDEDSQIVGDNDE